MGYIDDVIANMHALDENKRAVWLANAERTIAKGARGNAAYAGAQRLRAALLEFEATRPTDVNLIEAHGLEWDRAELGRTTFRGFCGERFVARVTRIKPRTFTVYAFGQRLPKTYTTLSAARAAAAGAYAAQFRWAA